MTIFLLQCSPGFCLGSGIICAVLVSHNCFQRFHWLTETYCDLLQWDFNEFLFAGILFRWEKNANILVWTILCIQMLYMWRSCVDTQVTHPDSYNPHVITASWMPALKSKGDQSGLTWTRGRKEDKSSWCKELILSFHHHSHHFIQVFGFGVFFFWFVTQISIFQCLRSYNSQI